MPVPDDFNRICNAVKLRLIQSNLDAVLNTILYGAATDLVTGIARVMSHPQAETVREILTPAAELLYAWTKGVSVETLREWPQVLDCAGMTHEEALAAMARQTEALRQITERSRAIREDLALPPPDWITIEPEKVQKGTYDRWTAAMQKMRRTDDTDTSTLECRCGGSVTWGGLEVAGLYEFLGRHEKCYERRDDDGNPD